MSVDAVFLKKTCFYMYTPMPGFLRNVKIIRFIFPNFHIDDVIQFLVKYLLSKNQVYK